MGFRGTQWTWRPFGDWRQRIGPVEEELRIIVSDRTLSRYGDESAVGSSLLWSLVFQ